MAKIRIEEIQEQLKEYNWECLSEEYINLQTPMRFKCDEGHIVETTWGKLRKTIYCPSCTANLKKHITNIKAKAKTENTRVLALDQSSNITGYSIFDGKELVSYGVFSTQNGASNKIGKLKEIAEWVDSMIYNWQPDVVGIEDVYLGPKGGVDTFKLLAQVMGVIMITVVRSKTMIKIVPAATWRSYCGVTGRERAIQKRNAQKLIKMWYDATVTEDEADAICIGKYLSGGFKPEIG